MILRELFYIDDETFELTDKDQYEPQYDDSIVDLKDKRKTRLTLRQINRVRKAAEIHTKNKSKELDFVRQMYGLAAQAEAGAI